MSSLGANPPKQGYCKQCYTNVIIYSPLSPSTPPSLLPIIVHTRVPADITRTNPISQAPFGLRIRGVLYLYSLLVGGHTWPASAYHLLTLSIQKSFCYLPCGKREERERENQKCVNTHHLGGVYYVN